MRSCERRSDTHYCVCRPFFNLPAVLFRISHRPYGTAISTRHASPAARTARLMGDFVRYKARNQPPLSICSRRRASAFGQSSNSAVRSPPPAGLPTARPSPSRPRSVPEASASLSVRMPAGERTLLHEGNALYEIGSVSAQDRSGLHR